MGGVVLFIGIGGKQEVTGEGSLEDLIPEQVGDFTLQTNEPLKAKPKDSTDARVLTYRSSDGTEVNHVVGLTIPRYAYTAKSRDSEDFATGFLKLPNGVDLGGEPKRSEFQVKDKDANEVGRGVLLQGNQSAWLAWINGRLNAVVKAPTGEDAQNFYDELPY